MNLELSFFENTVDPDQLAPDEDIRFWWKSVLFLLWLKIHAYSWEAAG